MEPRILKFLEQMPRNKLERLMKDEEYKKNNKHLAEQLTPRELEVIRLICQGLRNDDIARKLFISISTVIAHRKNIYLKVQVTNTAELVSLAYRLDLIDG